MTRRLAALLLATLTLTAASVFAKDKDSRNQWRVRHKLTNQRHEEGTPLLLRVKDHSIQALDRKVIVFDIPADQVQAITYDDDLHRPVREWLIGTAAVVSKDLVRQTLASDVRKDWTGITALSGMICAGSGAMFCRYKDSNFMGTLVGDVAMAAFASILDTHHQYRSIDLVWLQDGVVRNALFHVETHKEERLVLEALASETGKPWVDLTERRRQLHEQIEKYKLGAQKLVLDRTVLVNGEMLPAGEYRLVFTYREKDVQLDFFRGASIAAETFVAQATAQRKVNEEANAPQPHVAETIRYTETEPFAIAEITSNGFTYVLEVSAATPPEPVAVTIPSSPPMLVPPSVAATATPKPDMPVLTLTMKNGNTAQVTLVTYRGRRAFRFPVEHIHTKNNPFAKNVEEECAGSLYVMADQIAFDAGLNLHKDRDPFDVARTAITEAKIIPRSATSWGTIRVVVGKKKYDFMPYFSNTQSPLANLPGKGPSSAGAWVTAIQQLWKTGAAGQPMLNAFLDALMDFSGTVSQVENGHYNPAPHKKDEGIRARTPGSRAGRNQLSIDSH